MSKLPKRLRRIKTIEQFEATLGELTDEEKARLNDPSLYEPPTEEELARLPPHFTEMVLEMAKNRRGPP